MNTTDQQFNDNLDQNPMRGRSYISQFMAALPGRRGWIHEDDEVALIPHLHELGYGDRDVSNIDIKARVVYPRQGRVERLLTLPKEMWSYRIGDERRLYNVCDLPFWESHMDADDSWGPETFFIVHGPDLPDFSAYFQEGAPSQSDISSVLTFSCREIGSVLIPSGRIVVCDPGFFPQDRAFKIQVEPGRYPVTLSVAHRQEDGAERVAMAMLRFKPGIPQRWEVAVNFEQNFRGSSEDDFRGHGYWVESGHACFMSEEAVRFLIRKQVENDDSFESSKNPESMESLNYFLKTMQEDCIRSGGWLGWTLDDTSGLNLVLFPAGSGRGRYLSYWGFDHAGEIVCLVTDFGVVDSEDFDPEDEDL